ncbi:MAG: serine hydrolase, partial [Acidobacteriota bacterium]
YSCLGPILAGIALERISGRSLRALFSERIRRPLGISASELRYAPVPRTLRERTAPTETGRQRERDIALAMTSSSDDPASKPLFEGPLRGVVHDGNALFLGGAAGNAGLFGTAAAVFRLCSALATDGLLFTTQELELFRRPLGRSPTDIRTFGFQSGAAEQAPAGPFGPHSYGHVGFTGTSVWIDADRPLVAVLLTNRVHPRWTDAPVQAWRREFHALAAQLGGGARS